MLKRTMIQIGDLKGTVKYIAQAGQKKEGYPQAQWDGVSVGQIWKNVVIPYMEYGLIYGIYLDFIKFIPF